MPKHSIDYKQIVIYKIVCKDLSITDLYVGSTIRFSSRKNMHKSQSKQRNVKIYNAIREHGGWDNWEMVEIEKYPCNDGNEAHARERYWYETLGATLNSNCPNRSQKENKAKWDAENAEHIAEYRKKWLQNKSIQV